MRVARKGEGYERRCSYKANMPELRWKVTPHESVQKTVADDMSLLINEY